MNKTNAKDQRFSFAQLTSECFTSNKARLCHNHLANCENFKSTYTKEVEKFLSCSVPEDLKNNGYNMIEIFLSVKY